MWHILEPIKGTYNFTLLDTVFDKAESLGLKIMLGTPTATMPAWLYNEYPDVVTVSPDSSDGF